MKNVKIYQNSCTQITASYKGKFVCVQAMKAREWRNTSIHSLTTALEEDERSLLRSTDLSPAKETRMEDGS